MPLFNRSDGTLVKTTSRVRRMIPYLMKGRNESIVYHEQVIDVTKTQRFIDEWNQTHSEKITVFHVVMGAIARGMIARPGLNRFVSGGNTYQRNQVEISFAAKKQIRDYSALVTVKLGFPAGEPFPSIVERLHASVKDSRKDTLKPVDKELKLLLKIPGVLLGFLVGLVKVFDRWNLLPGMFIKNDPMFASIFVANLGSVGIDRTWHHLYEYGTVSLFCVIGSVAKMVVPDENDQPVVRPHVRLRFAFDERINDGHYCAASLAIMREYVENPWKFGEDDARGLQIDQMHEEDRKRDRDAFEAEKRLQ